LHMCLRNRRLLWCLIRAATYVPYQAPKIYQLKTTTTSSTYSRTRQVPTPNFSTTSRSACFKKLLDCYSSFLNLTPQAPRMYQYTILNRRLSLLSAVWLRRSRCTTNRTCIQNL
jgi:hypothetical protein